jgi:hypothetical protein
MEKEFAALIVFFLVTVFYTGGVFALFRLPNRKMRAIYIIAASFAYLVISFFIIEWASSGGWPEGIIVAPVVIIAAPVLAVIVIIALIVNAFMAWERGRPRTIVMWVTIGIALCLLAGAIFFRPIKCNRFINKLDSEDAWERSYAASRLGECGCKKAVPMLIYALGDGDEGVRTSAVFALGSIDDPSAYPEVKKMLTDESPDVRRAAAYVIVPLVRGDQEEVISLLIGLLSDEDEEVRFAAESGLEVLDEDWQSLPGVPEDYKGSYE